MEEKKNDVEQDSVVAEENGASEKEVKTDDKPAENNKEEQKEEKQSNDAELKERSTVEDEKSNNGESKEEPAVESKEESNNVESKEEPTPELLEKIKKQVEFYFGDVNMQRDRFLIQQTKLDNGWVPMTVMLNFKLLASLSKDIDVILKALEDSELIEISDDKKNIRRTLDKPLPTYDDNYRKAQEARTVYLKGFPADSTIEILMKHFESTKDVENIIMRKYKKGKESFFKGSIFLQFKTLEGAKAFMEQESVKYNDTELIKLWSADYVASKEKERDEWRQKKATNQILKIANTKGSKNQDNTQDKLRLPKGCIIHISNLQKEITREKIKERLIEMQGEVAFIDYNTGDLEGWIRLQGENSAAELMKKLDTNVIKVNDCDIACKLLEGEEEEAYLLKTQENMKNRRFNRRDRGRNARNFKRGHSPHRDSNAKKLRVDDS